MTRFICVVLKLISYRKGRAIDRFNARLGGDE